MSNADQMQRDDACNAPVAELLSDSKDRVAEAKRRFDCQLVDYSPQDNAVEALDDVRLAGQRRQVGVCSGGAMMVAPPGTGKTKAIEKLCRRLNGGLDPDRICVLNVKLSTAGTTDSVATSILTALGKPRPDLGKESLRWSKAVEGMQKAEVELTIFDDFDRAARRPTMSAPIASAIRERIVDPGVAPIAIVGSEAAGVVLRSAPELMERLDEEIDLEPLDWIYTEDQTIFMQFAAAFDQAMLSSGILPRLSGLGERDIAERLCEAAGGRIRRCAKIIRAAMALAVRRAAPTISVDDLEAAVNAYVIPRRFLDYNPFMGKGA